MTRQGTHFYNKIGVRQMLAVLAFFVCAVFFFPGIVSANSGADGAGTGGDDGSPTDGAGLYATSTVWSSSASTTWTVPSGVTEIKIKVWGAGGGSGKGNGTVASLAGGPGGYAEGVMTVTPGQELSVKVGAGGSGGDGTSAAGGGGLSWVASGGTPWVIAGSGGGSGQVGPEESPAESKGGAGGGTTGYGGDGGGGGTQNGDNGGDGGGAGTPTAGGAASGGATSGAYLTGGSAEVTANMDGGDGGAGYYGGGGGEDSDNATGGGGGAGGGGSSYVISSASATSTVAGSDTDRTQPGNYTDPDYQSGAGYGAAGSSGSGNSGNDGLVIIYYVSPETVSGTVYESDGVTDVGSGKTIKVVIATTTPGIYSGTTDSNGEYLIEADLFTPTGKFWATTTAAGDNDPWRSVIYNESDGLYVAVGNSGTGDRVITSPDGTTWTARTSPVAQWNSVTYGEGLYVAVGGGGTYAVMTSPDGTNWTGRNAAGDDDTWQSVTYGNGTFVAVGVDGDKVMYSSDGITWSTASIAGIDDSAWTSVTYGEGIFVAVACGSGSSCNAISSDRFMSSSNGSSWRAGLGQSGDNTGSDDGWKSVTYGNGTFVAVSGIGDRVAYSSGGAAWATTTAAGNNDAWQSVTYGNGRFVAVACGSGNSCNTTESDRVMVSSDGVMWTTYSTDVVGNDDYWWDITYGDNLFVAVGYSGDRVMLSEPGVNETTPITVYVDGNSIKASLLSYGFNSESSTASGNDLVDKTVQIKHISSGTVDLAVANHYDYDNDTDILIDLETATTTVGIVGTATTSLYSVATTTFSTALELTGDLYLGVVSDVTDMNLYLLGSSTIASTLSGVLNSVEVSGDAAINTNASTTDLTVTTGATLSASSSVTLTGDFTQNGSIDFANNTLYVEGGGSSLSGDFVDTNNLGDVVFGVDKLTSWATTTVAGDAGYWRGIAYGSSTYVAVAYGGGTQRVMSSSDALTWTVRTAAGDNDAWRAVAYGNGTFVAVSSSGDRVMTSPDGITWTARSAADNNDSWYGVTYGGGQFVAVGTAGDRVMTSPDGITWTARSAADNNDSWYGVTYGGGTYVAVGGSGDRVMYSSDGITWATTTAAGDNDTWQSVAYGRGVFVAVGAFGDRVMTSPDGITWTVETAADDDDSWYDIIYVSEDERFIAAALTGERIIMASPVIVELPDVSMQDMVIHSGFIRASSSLEVMGNYTNNDIFSASTSEVVFAGTSQQTATGTLSGDSAFYDLTVSNASQDGATNQSVIFGMPIEVTNTFSMSAGTSARFPAGATSTLENIDLQGTSGNEVYLRSSSNGSYWSVDVPGEQTNVLYVNVKDSYASSTITAYNSTDGTNNVNWSFDTLITGSTTVANHDATQVNNAFNFQNKTNEAIFAFKLIPESGTATVTDLTLTITGAEKVDQNDFSNIRLYRDNDNDAAYDASDEQVGGAGTMEIAGDTGTITFTGDFLSTTTKNYIVVIDWNAPSNGSYMTINLFTSGVTAVDGNGTQDIYGSVSRVQHSRNNRGGGGSPSSQIGGAPPAGDGDVGGGGSGGGADPGEQIGSDPNYKRPSANSGSWTNGANAYDQTDGTYATDNADASETYSNHGFAYSGTTVDGVEVRLEVSGSTAAGSINVELSWNGGVNWTTAKSTGTLSDSDTVVSVGGATDTWGRTWSLTDFSDANFRVRLTSVTSSNTVQVDEIQVRAYVSTSGGGSGGGGGSDI